MNIDLDAIRQRADAATKGPWTVGKRKLDSADVYALPILSPSTDEENPDEPDELAVIHYWAGAFQYPHADARNDAEFIAHAREDIPALLDAIAELRAENQKLRADLEYARRSRFEYEERVVDQVENLRAKLADAEAAAR